MPPCLISIISLNPTECSVFSYRSGHNLHGLCFYIRADLVIRQDFRFRRNYQAVQINGVPELPLYFHTGPFRRPASLPYG